MKRCTALIISAALILTLFTACSNGQPRTSNDQSNVQSQQSGTSGDQSKAPAIDSKAIAEKLKSTSLSAVSFTANTNAGTSGTFNADGTPLTLTYTDGAYNWKFDFPADALRNKTEIKITAMKDIKSDALGNVPCGAVLEPDGLNFTAPVTVTVSGGNLGAKAFMLTGKSDGTGMIPTICAGDNGTLTTKIFHFSGLAVTDNSSNDDKMKILTEVSKTKYKEYLDIAKSLLSQPLEIPEPPDISLRCVPGTHSPDYSALDPYRKQFLSPEGGILVLLGGAITILKANNPDFLTDNDMKIVSEIAKRLNYKGKELIKRYSPAQEKYVACIEAFRDANALYTAYSELFSTSNEVEPDFTPILINYSKAVSESLLKDLTEKHDFTAVCAIMRVMNEFNPYTEANFRWDNPWNDFYNTYEENLFKALTFTVETEYSQKDFSVDKQGSSKASVKITPVLNQYGFYWEGTGNGHRKISFPSTLIYLSPGDYTFTAKVQHFDTCVNRTIDVVIDKFGPDTEQVQLVGSDHVWVRNPGDIKDDARIFFGLNINLFENDPTTTDDYKMIFHLDISNLSATVAEKTFESNARGMAEKMTIRVIHTPE